MRINYNSQKGKHIFIKEKGKTHQILLENITHVICNSTICTVFLIDKKISVYKRLKEFENELAEYFFFKTNRNTLINMKYMTSFVKVNNEHFILLNNTKIPVSRRKRAELNTILSL